MDTYQQYIHTSRYAKWIESEKRRETWDETVDRYVSFLDKKTNFEFSDTLNNEIKPAVLRLENMPSMRCLMSAGEALDRENIAGYNCSYLAVNNKEAFSESLYILMCGTGVGFSCERQEVSQLPDVPFELNNVDTSIIVADSKQGWAKAYAEFIDALYLGNIHTVDYSLVRAKGERLKTFGGRASGPDPLRKLFDYTQKTFLSAKGRKLNSLEVHDIMCMIGEIVVVGGVRRSALISLSNLSDQRMRSAKSGQWWEENAQRGLANNSVAYTEKPNIEIFMEEWLSLVKSKSGERGIINREALQKQASKWGRRDSTLNYGTNPCAEIILRDKQFCNLTTCIVTSDDDLDSMKKKIRIATIMGTFQATLTDFGFISKSWTDNTVQESLLGVSLTGIKDNLLFSGMSSGGTKELTKVLNELRSHAREINHEWSLKLNINPSAAITCIKPEGTVSQLTNTASGMHDRHSDYYIRTVRVDKKDPLYPFMLDQGLPTEDDVMRPDTTAVVSFAVKSPNGCTTRNDVTALQALDLWLLYQREFCEHKPSVTITVREEEWLDVGAWVYRNFDEASGVSFLPHSDHSYEQAPYQEITEEEYNNWIRDNPLPKIDWSKLSNYEEEDNTVAMQTLACVGGSCSID